MALDEHGNGLRYAENVGTFSVYEMFLNHRPAFEVVIDNDDPELVIHTARVGTGVALKEGVPAKSVLNVTKGRAKISLHEGTSELIDGIPVPSGVDVHINGRTVQRYVYPRTPFLLADLYIPRAQPPTGDYEDANGHFHAA